MHGTFPMSVDRTLVSVGTIEVRRPGGQKCGLRSRRRTIAIGASCVSIAMLCLIGAPRLAHAQVFQVGANGTFAPCTKSTGDVIEIGALANDDGSALAEEAPDIPVGALTSIDAPTVPLIYQTSLTRAADTARVSPTLLAALVWRESRWRPAALSPKGARGLTQLMPATARALAVDPADAASNLAGGARYLRRMLDMFDGNVERALAAYNAGPGRVLKSTTDVPNIAETRAYVSAIIDRLGGDTASALGGIAK